MSQHCVTARFSARESLNPRHVGKARTNHPQFYHWCYEPSKYGWFIIALLPLNWLLVGYIYIYIRFGNIVQHTFTVVAVANLVSFKNRMLQFACPVAPPEMSTGDE